MPEAFERSTACLIPLKSQEGPSNVRVGNYPTSMPEPLVGAARELLCRYSAFDLLDELLAWELARERHRGPRYEAPRELNAKTVITLDGIPGAGKSTTQRWLQPALGAAYFSMARFAEARGVSADDRRQHQLATGHPHPVDEAFLAALAACPARFIVLEKFPRSVVESTAMVEAARAHGWRFEVLHLQLPGDCVASSTRRQLERGPRHGRMPEPDYARHRALVHLARATSGRETLRQAAVPLHAVDMTRPAEETARRVRQVLGLDAEALPLRRQPLAILERVAREVGVEEAWVSSGSVYRPFWNGRFGPVQRPTDVDVAVNDERAVAPLLRALERAAPEERWSVLCPSTRLWERYGLETQTVAEAKRFSTFLHRSGLMRLREGVAEVHLGEGVEACLRNGVVQLSAPLLERLDAVRRAAVLERETHHLPRALSDYPGVRLEEETSRLLAGGPHWRAHRPRRVVTHWATLKALAVDAQRGRERDAQAFCRRALGPEEETLAQEILRFHQRSDFLPAAPQLPARARVAEALTGLGPVAREADDAVFGEWFLDQVHHHAPRGGPDAYLRSVLDFSVFSDRVRGLQAAQSALHQGWSLDRHLAQSVLELRTDALLARLSSTHDAEWRKDLRLSMRMAMLFHDTGKLLGQRPRRHALISARLFTRFRPDWFPARLVPMTQWLIRTHDLFGAFGRGLTDKEGATPADYDAVQLSLTTSYFAALDSQAVRAVLRESGLPLDEAAAVHKAIWRADIGSISALRWLLPVADLVERLVLAPEARDRRRR